MHAHNTFFDISTSLCSPSSSIIDETGDDIMTLPMYMYTEKLNVIRNGSIVLDPNKLYLHEKGAQSL